jgi:hypothetical protein
LFLLLSVDTGTVAHPASYPVGIGGRFSRDNASGNEAEYTLPTDAKVRDTSIRQYIDVCIRLLGAVLNYLSPVLLLPLSLPGEIEQVLERTSYKWMTE